MIKLSKASSKYLKILGWFFILLSIVIIVTSFVFNLGFPFASISLLLLGILTITINVDEEDVLYESTSKCRDTALAKALIPGLGNIYLGEYKKGMLILCTFFFGIIMMILPFIFGEDMLACMIYALPLILFSLVYSSIEATESCNKLNLPFNNGMFELHINDTTLAKSLTFAIFSVVILLMDPYVRSGALGYDIRQLWIADVCAVILLIYSLFIYVQNKRINLKNKMNEKGC